MAMSPMGYYLRRNQDGSWSGVCAGLDSSGVTGHHFEVPATARPKEAHASGAAGRPWWARLLDLLREGLDQPDLYR